jgi:hypothetical protein
LVLGDGKAWWGGFAICDCDGWLLGLGYWGFSARGSSSLGLAGADWRGTGDDVKGFLGEAKKDIPDRDCCEQEDDL